MPYNNSIETKKRGVYMQPIFEYVIEFVMAFTLVILYYKLIAEKIDPNVKKNKPIAEVNIFIKMFKINTNLVDIKKLSNILMLTNAFNVSLVLLCTEITKNILLKILIIIFGIVLFTYMSYQIVAFVYRKKGMTKNV